MSVDHETPRPVFLMTDFGESDPYVGLMKAVLLEGAPTPNIVDLTHEIPPQDETNATFLLEYVVPDLPAGSVVLLVVDPEVGTERDIIAVETEESVTVVAPDTGLTEGLNWRRARLVTNDELSRATVSSTFHGRDWFAPVGRYLSRRGSFEELGPETEKNPDSYPLPEPTVGEDEIRGTVVHEDHFGNLVTNIERERLENHWSNWRNRVEVQLEDRRIQEVAPTYEEACGPAALVGSFERLEVAVPGGSAADRFDTGTGTEVVVREARVPQDV